MPQCPKTVIRFLRQLGRESRATFEKYGESDEFLILDIASLS